MPKLQSISGSTILASCLLCFTLVLGGQPSFAQNSEDIAMLDRSGKAFSTVVKKAGPAVVHIAVEKSKKSKGQGMSPYDLLPKPYPGPQSRHPSRQDQRHFEQQAAGSGFIISSDGYILTNSHVVADVDMITVRLADKREFPAKVIGTDPQSDVAIIKIEGSNLPVLPLGNSDTMEVGEWVIAIGSPFELNQTVTVGVVSAKGRNRMGINDYENFIQTDAAINPGNSGGPLLNIYGEAIGMNTAIFSRSGGYMGIGFAIPINMAKDIEQQLRNKGKVTRGWLGIIIQDVNEGLAKSFGLKDASGVLVSEVTENSPAKKNGLFQGDIVTGINGTPVVDVADLRNKIAMTPPNTELPLQVIRDGKQMELVLTVGEQPADLDSLAPKITTTPLSEMGLSLQNLTEEVAKQFGYAKDQGVLIADVDPDSPAGRVGLQAGQLVEEVNKIRVKNLQELRQVLERTENTNQLLLRIRAGEYSQYVVLQTR